MSLRKEWAKWTRTSQDLSRTCIDEYTVSKLTAEYEASGGPERLHLLKSFCVQDSLDPALSGWGAYPPFEIVKLAVEDPHLPVRIWIARHLSQLDYSDEEHPDRNLADKIQEDPDPTVRAGLLENPAMIKWGEEGASSERLFKQASHFERLALLRNPGIGLDFLLKIFNHEDDSLQIEIKERAELVRAYLTNLRSIKKFSDNFTHAYDYGDSEVKLAKEKTVEQFSQLWLLISKWPDQYVLLKCLLYRLFPASDTVKAEVLHGIPDSRTEKDPHYSFSAYAAILDDCDSIEELPMKAGIKHADPRCRIEAYSKIKYYGFEEDVVSNALKGKDPAALAGLARNKNLSLEELEQVIRRCNTLRSPKTIGEDDGWSWQDICNDAEMAILNKEKEEKESPTPPDFNVSNQKQ